MDVFVVAIFDSEEASVRGADRMRELHNLADIHVFSGAIIEKNNDGLVTLKSTVNEGPVATATGYWIGAFLGVLAGPAAVAAGAVTAAVGTAALTGAAAGGLTGSFMGMTRDLLDQGMSEDLIDIVGTEMKPGHVAIVALIDELATLPLDEAMAAEGARLFRQPKNDVTDERISGDVETAAIALNDLIVDFEDAREADRDLIKVKARGARSKLETAVSTAKERETALKQELEYRMSSIEDQLGGASAERRRKLEERRADLKTEFDGRFAKLTRALKAAEAVRTEW